MSLDPHTYSAFGDELTKIAGAKAGIGKTLSGWARKGWDDWGGVTPGKRRLFGLRAPAKVRGEGWLGKQDTWRRNLPVGGKSIAVGLTGAMVPSALGKADPLGQARSRTERSVDLGADVGGSLLGAGAALSLPGKKFRLARSIGGAIGGGLLGSRIATTPWRASRERASRPVLSGRERQQLMSQGVVGNQ